MSVLMILVVIVCKLQGDRPTPKAPVSSWPPSQRLSSEEYDCCLRPFRRHISDSSCPLLPHQLSPHSHRFLVILPQKLTFSTPSTSASTLPIQLDNCASAQVFPLLCFTHKLLFLFYRFRHPALILLRSGQIGWISFIAPCRLDTLVQTRPLPRRDPSCRAERDDEVRTTSAWGHPASSRQLRRESPLGRRRLGRGRYRRRRRSRYRLGPGHCAWRRGPSPAHGGEVRSR